MTIVSPVRATAGTFGPNWFTTVMGTGIVATSAAVLPVHLPGQRLVALAVWALAAAVLASLAVTWPGHLRRHRYLDDPVALQAWGAVPMAVLTVGGGAMLLDVPGATAIGVLCWCAGAVGGALTSVAIPYLMITRHVGEDAFGGWLMPVVPPMVAAANGALLATRLPDGAVRAHLLLACYAMFGASLVAALVVLTQVWSRLVTAGPGPVDRTPTLWIALGPLGQSITAAHLLAAAVPARYADDAGLVAVLYGVPVLGFALLWLSLATALTLRAARAGLGFSMTWWSFTFPVGTLVTATAGLASRTGSAPVAALSVVLFGALVTAWATVATRTVRDLRTAARHR